MRLNVGQVNSLLNSEEKSPENFLSPMHGSWNINRRWKSLCPLRTPRPFFVIRTLDWLASIAVDISSTVHGREKSLRTFRFRNERSITFSLALTSSMLFRTETHRKHVEKIYKNIYIYKNCSVGRVMVVARNNYSSYFHVCMYVRVPRYIIRRYIFWI